MPPGPGMMSAVAATPSAPLAKRLGIKPGHVVVITGGAPAGFADAIDLPEGARLFHQLRPATVDVVVCFVDRVTELERRLSHVLARLHPDGGLWVAWPRKSSRRATDITEDVVRRIGLAGGMVDNKVCAIDGVWSGLRLVVRVENRAAVAYRVAPPPVPLPARRRRRAPASRGAGGSTLRRALARPSR